MYPSGVSLKILLLLTQWSIPKGLKFRQKVLLAGDDEFKRSLGTRSLRY